MRKWASTSAKSVLLAAGFVALGSGIAYADSDAATSGNGSVLGGNQAVANADVPVNVTGNAVGAVAGIAGASSTDSDAKVIDHNHNDVRSSGNGSLAGGNQLVVDGDVPVNVSGNAVGAVGGVAGAAATDADSVVHHSSGDDGYGYKEDDGYGYKDKDHHGHGSDDPDIATSGNGSLIGGNQIVGDLDVPVNVSGNAVGAVGGVAGAAATDADAIVRHHQAAEVEHQAGELTATDLVSEVTENAQVLPDTSGVDAGVLQQSAPDREHQSIATSGNGSLLGGNQLVVDGDVPVNVTGNAIGALGGVAGAASTDSTAKVEDVERDIRTSGNGSLAGGNQIVGDLDVPVNVSGNAVGAVAGMAGASSTGDGAEVVHHSAETEEQSAATDSAPLVGELPEVPVSEMLPVGYDLTETADRAVEEPAPEQAPEEVPEQAPEQAPEEAPEQAPEQVEEQAPELVEELPEELPEATDIPDVDPVGDLLGAAGIGL
ncbi:prolipoprotein diacylglyceryl transferase [Nocardiopsis nanhaiensis]